MPRWTVDSPTALDFDGVVALRVRIVAGSVAVLASADRPRLDVTDISGQPLQVSHEAGILTITYADLTWDGVLGWLRPHRHSASLTITVQHDCPAQLGVVSAPALVSGLSAKTSLKSVSGDLTLDGVTGSVDVSTVSGNLEVQGLEGSLAFHSVSGDLTVAGGCVGRLDARTVTGRVTTDFELADAGDLRVGTVSGEVAIRLPAATSAQVDLRSASGLVRTDFDTLSPSRAPGPRVIAGRLGDGSARLSAASMSGDVTILRRSHAASTDDGDEPRDQALREKEPPGEERPAAMGSGGTTTEGGPR